MKERKTQTEKYRENEKALGPYREVLPGEKVDKGDTVKISRNGDQVEAVPTRVYGPGGDSNG